MSWTQSKLNVDLTFPLIFFSHRKPERSYCEQADGYEEEKETEFFVSLVQCVDQRLQPSEMSDKFENPHYPHHTNQANDFA